MMQNNKDTKNELAERESDRIQNFFIRPFFLSLTIGVPFCIFKLLFGMTAIRVSMISSQFLIIPGSVIVAWAVFDLFMNVSRALLDLFHRPGRFEYCIIAQLGRLFHMPMAFLALDTLITFVIICLMLWSGWITLLTPSELYLWYAATTLNLISLSLVSLYNEIRHSRNAG